MLFLGHNLLTAKYVFIRSFVFIGAAVEVYHHVVTSYLFCSFAFFPKQKQIVHRNFFFCISRSRSRRRHIHWRLGFSMLGCYWEYLSCVFIFSKFYDPSFILIFFYFFIFIEAYRSSVILFESKHNNLKYELKKYYVKFLLNLPNSSNMEPAQGSIGASWGSSNLYINMVDFLDVVN